MPRFSAPLTTSLALLGAALVRAQMNPEPHLTRIIQTTSTTTVTSDTPVEDLDGELCEEIVQAFNADVDAEKWVVSVTCGEQRRYTNERISECKTAGVCQRGADFEGMVCANAGQGLAEMRCFDDEESGELVCGTHGCMPCGVGEIPLTKTMRCSLNNYSCLLTDVDTCCEGRQPETRRCIPCDETRERKRAGDVYTSKGSCTSGPRPGGDAPENDEESEKSNAAAQTETTIAVVIEPAPTKHLCNSDADCENYTPVRECRATPGTTNIRMCLRTPFDLSREEKQRIADSQTEQPTPEPTQAPKKNNNRRRGRNRNKRNQRNRRPSRNNRRRNPRLRRGNGDGGERRRLADLSCELLKTRSAAECVEGVSWGCNFYNGYLWTTNGCRGTFKWSGHDSEIMCGQGGGRHLRFVCDLPTYPIPGGMTEVECKDRLEAVTTGIENVAAKFGVELTASEPTCRPKEADACGLNGVQIAFRKEDVTQTDFNTRSACECRDQCSDQDAWIFNKTRNKCFCRMNPHKERRIRATPSANYVSDTVVVPRRGG